MREKETPSKADQPTSTSQVKVEVPDIVVVPEAPDGSPVDPPNPIIDSRLNHDIRKFSIESSHSIDTNSISRKISTDSGVNMDQLIGEPRLAFPPSTSKTSWSSATSTATESASSLLARPKARKVGMADSLYNMSLYNNMSQDLSSPSTAPVLPNPYLLNIAAAQNNMAEMIKSHEQLVNAFKQQAQYLSSVALAADPTLLAGPARGRMAAPAGSAHPPSALPTSALPASAVPLFPPRKARSDCTPISALQNLQNASQSPPGSSHVADEDNLSSCSARSSHSLKDEGQVSSSSHSNGHNASHSSPSSETSHNAITSSHLSSLPKRKNAMLMGPQPGDGLGASAGGSPLPFQGNPTLPLSTGNGPLPYSSGNGPFPLSKLSTASLPSSGRLANRKRPRTIPEDLKDPMYWERRRKNNEAAKRSRDTRRAKDDEIACRASILEQENCRLRSEVSNLRVQLNAISQELEKRKSGIKESADSKQTEGIKR